ncbi:MAG: exopolysaccharide transport family protein [bacterium]
MEIDSFDVRRSINTIWNITIRYKWIVLGTCLFTVALTLLYIQLFPWVYKASVKILVEKEKDEIKDQFYGQWNIFRKAEEAKTEAEMAKLGPVVKKVVENLNLKYDDVYHPLMRHITDMWSRSWIGRKYKRIKNFFFPPEKSPFNLTPQEIELAKTIFDFQKGINVRAIGNSNVAEISVLAPGKRVAEIANELTKVYLQYRRQQHEEEAISAANILNTQVKRAHEKLEKIEKELEDYVVKNNIKFEFEKEHSDVKILTDQEAELLTTRASIEGLEARLAEIEHLLQNEGQMEIDSRSLSLNEIHSKMKANLLNYEMMLIQMQNRYTEDSQEVEELKSNISRLKDMLKESEEMVISGKIEKSNPIWSSLRAERTNLLVQLAQLRAGETEIQEIVNQYKNSLKDLPFKQRVLQRLTRELVLADTEYRTLLSKQRQAFISAVTESEKTASLKLIETAQIPERPIRPKVKLYLFIAVLIGILLGIIAGFIANYFNETIYSEDDVGHILDIPVYGNVHLGIHRNKTPSQFTPEQKKGWLSGWSESRYKKNNQYNKSYHKLAMQLHFELGGSERGYCLMLSCPYLPEVTSQFALELAEFLAIDQNRKVLIIDAFFRDNLLSKEFKISSSPGFLNMLDGTQPLTDSLIHLTDYPKVFFLPAGKSNYGMTHLMTSNQLKEKLTQLQEQFDVVLLSSDSVMEDPSAFAFPSIVDCTMLLVMSKVSQWSEIKSYRNILNKCNLRKMGLIIVSR